MPGNNTLVDWANSIDPNGKVYTVAELLNQSNELVPYVPFVAGNLPTGHKGAVRTGLPAVTMRQFYKGVAPQKSGRNIVEDVCAMAEARNEIDKDLADLNGEANAYRMSEGLAFIESMTQKFAQQLIYGDTSQEPDGILGLTPRYNDKTAQSGANIIDAGGTGADNTSVWLVGFGENTVHGIFPKGSQAGLYHEDLGIIDAFDDTNNRYRAYAELWNWKFGLHIKDWRYVVRIANIDVSDLTSQTGTQAVTAATWLNKLMIKALARIPSMGMSKPVFLTNRTVKEMLSVGALDKSQNALSFTEGLNQYGPVTAGSVAGTGTGISGGSLKFMGVPVLTVDQILSTEAAI